MSHLAHADVRRFPYHEHMTNATNLPTRSYTELERAFWAACDRLDAMFHADVEDYYQARDDLFDWLDEVAGQCGTDVALRLAESAGFPWE